MPVEQWQQLIDLNLTSSLVCCQQLCKGMLARGRGSVVNVTSIAGPWVSIPNIGGRHYETAKAALTGLTRAMAADWATLDSTAPFTLEGVLKTGSASAIASMVGCVRQCSEMKAIARRTES